MNRLQIHSREVSWNVLGTEIYGTLTSPENGENFPSAIFVAGSGPTDRDWCSPLLPGNNGSGKLLAEKLADNGVTTLRYDKIASGPHVRENLPKFTGKISMQYHVEELSGAVETMISQPGVDPGNLFVITNSEGAIHAVNYQLGIQRHRFSGMILSGAPGRSVGDVARSQLVAQASGVPDAEVIMRKYDEAVSEFVDGKQITMDPVFPDALKMLLKSLETPANLPFSRELWAYRLADHIGKILEPVMILTGKKDIQVNWKVDGKILEEALSRHPDASFVYPDNADHVLKHEDMPLDKLTAEYVTAHYNSPGRMLDGEAVNHIISWINDRKEFREK